MSLQMFWSLFAAHPAKLVNLLALLLTCPGGLFLHSARRQASQLLADGPQDEISGRIGRFYYILGFAFLAMALLLSWLSTWV